MTVQKFMIIIDGKYKMTIIFLQVSFFYSQNTIFVKVFVTSIFNCPIKHTNYYTS